jgi:hypothetical protein
MTGPAPRRTAIAGDAIADVGRTNDLASESPVIALVNLRVKRDTIPITSVPDF